MRVLRGAALGVAMAAVLCGVAACGPAGGDAKQQAESPVTPAPQGRETVGFGHRVTFARNGGAPQTFALVGEDEADPRRGSISYVAPLARLLMGKPVGESFHLGKDEIEILAIA